MESLFSSVEDYIREQIAVPNSSLSHINVSERHRENSEQIHYKISVDVKESKTVSMSFVVEPHEKLYDEITQAMSEVRSGITLDNGSIRWVALRNTHKASKFGSELYTADDADFEALVCVHTHKLPEAIEKELTSKVKNDIRKIDPTVYQDDIQTLQFIFSDLDENTLRQVRGQIKTAQPQAHLPSISSRIDFHLKTKGNPKNSYNQIQLQDKYKIEYFMNNSKEEVPTEIKEYAESWLANFVSQTVNTEFEYLLEGEAISIGEVPEFEGGSGVTYFLNIPITNGQVGISRN